MDSSSLQSSPYQTRSRSEDKQGEQGGTVEQDRGMGDQVKKTGTGNPGKQKCSKEVYFALLPDKYEPLIEELEEEIEESAEEKKKRKEEKKKKKKARHKKYRKVRGGDVA